MTREEMIKELKTVYLGDSIKMREAKNMAIETLEQEPCDDCVSRKAVLKIYDEWFATCNIADKKESPKRKMKALPPVAPQPKMGRWNFTKHYGRDYYVCSFCGMERMDDHSSGWNYCPNCGAKMSEIPTEAEGSDKE